MAHLLDRINLVVLASLRRSTSEVNNNRTTRTLHNHTDLFEEDVVKVGGHPLSDKIEDFRTRIPTRDHLLPEEEAHTSTICNGHLVRREEGQIRQEPGQIRSGQPRQSRRKTLEMHKMNRVSFIPQEDRKVSRSLKQRKVVITTMVRRIKRIRISSASLSSRNLRLSLLHDLRQT